MMNKTIKNIILIILTGLLCLSYIHANSNVNTDSLLCLKKDADNTTLVKIYNQLAEHYYNINLDSCLKYNELAFQLLETNNNKQKILAYNIRGMIDGKKGFYKECLNYLYKALGIAEHIRDTFLIARLYNNIGVSYLEIRDVTNAEKYLHKALLFKDNKTVKIGPVYNNLGLISQNNGNLDDAYEFYNKALESFKTNNNSTGIVSATCNIGIVLFSMGKRKQSMERLKESLNICRKLSDSLRMATILVNIGYNYMKMQNYKYAEEYFNQGNNIANNLKNIELKNNIYHAYSRLYERFGNKRKSLEYYKLFHQFSDSLFNIEKQNQIAELNVRYETIRRNKKIELLNKDRQINVDRVKMRTRWIIVVVTATILILVFCIIVVLIKRDQVLSKIILVRKNIEIAEKQVALEKSSVQYNNKIVSELKYSHSNLNEQQKNNLYNLVVSILINEKIYLQNDLTITKLSDYLNVSRTYLSQIINEKFNKSFSTLINEYRIIEARKELLNNRQITIEAIANNVGFKSKSSFNTAFKKYTGVTPSFFIKNSINTSDTF